MKLNPNTTASAAAVTVGGLFIACRILVAIFPVLSMSVAQAWFHGLELSKVSGWNLSLGSFILGLITSVASAWLAGLIFAKTYNYLLASK